MPNNDLNSIRQMLCKLFSVLSRSTIDLQILKSVNFGFYFDTNTFWKVLFLFKDSCGVCKDELREPN